MAGSHQVFKGNCEASIAEPFNICQDRLFIWVVAAQSLKGDGDSKNMLVKRKDAETRMFYASRGSLGVWFNKKNRRDIHAF